MRKKPDNWGRDPAVQGMRRVFAEMERIQKTLLDQVRMSPFDGRLRSVRAAALDLFDKAAARAVVRGRPLTDTAMIDIYTACLHHAMTNAGIAVSPELLPDDRMACELVREAFR